MSQIDQNTSGHWMVRLADSDLFRKLPAANIRSLLERIEKVDVRNGDVIIQEGDPGDYYYIIEQGRCRVTRELPNGLEAELTVLGRGEAFGEEEMVAGTGRNATVTMITDGELLRLGSDDFIDIVRDALVDKVPFAIAQRMSSEGALWLDVRAPQKFATLALPDAVNVPLCDLRERSVDLLKDQGYIVCGDDWGATAVGTLLLAQRGFDAVCMTEPLSTILDAAAEPVEARTSNETVVAFPAAEDDEPDETETTDEVTTAEADDPVSRAEQQERALGVEDVSSTTPIPRNLYDDTYVGQSLADLIDQMHTRHKELLNPDDSGQSAETAGGSGSNGSVIDLESFEDQVDRTLPAGDNEAPALILTNDADSSGDAAARAGAVTKESDVDREIARIMHGIETQLRGQVEQLAEQERARAQAELADKVANVKKAAVREVRKQVEKYRDRYREQHLHKQRRLKLQYDKLMGLAHRISRQKAELQRARKQLQVKLEATARLKAEIDGLRDTLTLDIDALDDFGPTLPDD